MLFILSVVVVALIFTINHLYKHGKNILSFENNTPTSTEHLLVENAIDDYFNNDTSQYMVFNNLKLPDYERVGKFISVDTLLVSTAGIFIISYTNIEGTISYTNEQGYIKLSVNDYEKVFLPPKDMKTVVRLAQYFPNIDKNKVSSLVIYNDKALNFNSKIPINIINVKELISHHIAKNNNTLQDTQLLVPLGMITQERIILDKVA